MRQSYELQHQVVLRKGRDRPDPHGQEPPPGAYRHRRTPTAQAYRQRRRIPTGGGQVATGRY